MSLVVGLWKKASDPSDLNHHSRGACVLASRETLMGSRFIPDAGFAPHPVDYRLISGDPSLLPGMPPVLK